ncbi:CBS domain-containing protein [uncultured Bdellovibrio sp.]|uniref:CBS domain-containing protein n=1 Tax=Bdellovibrio sp. HCB-162 TaxID=3394234 RepID=UPI0025D5E560|nr:CBS domain-containing protein [uncultured Bdellovibrio sp.]
MEAKMTHQETGTRKANLKLRWEKSRIVSISPDADLTEAAKLMKDQQVGDVLVMGGQGPSSIQGIITDRDIALCVATNKDISSIRVGDIMSPSVVTGNIDDDIFKLAGLMKNSGVTRLPLMGQGNQVIGVVTARNLIEVLLGALFDLVQISETQHQNERAHH